MKLRSAVVTLALSSSVALAACGSDDKDEAKAEEKATPAQAIAEIGETRAGLDTALKQLEDGDRSAADETVSETYLQHFEHVEGPLDEVDHELNEELEDKIREELREKITSDAPAAEVTKLVDEIKADLDTAEEKLQ